jgi:hypothetical protein
MHHILFFNNYGGVTLFTVIRRHLPSFSDTYRHLATTGFLGVVPLHHQRLLTFKTYNYGIKIQESSA